MIVTFCLRIGIVVAVIAAQIGTVRELVSRNLSRLQSEGILKIDGRTVIVCNVKALEAETDSAE